MVDVLPKRNLPEAAEPWGRRIEEIVQGIESSVGRISINVNSHMAGFLASETGTSARWAEYNEAIEQMDKDLAENKELIDATKVQIAELEEYFAEGGEFDQRMATIDQAIIDFGPMQDRLDDAEAAVSALEEKLAPGGEFQTQLAQAAADVQAVQDSLAPTGTVGQQLADNAAALTTLSNDLDSIDDAVAQAIADAAAVTSTAQSAQNAAAAAQSEAASAKSSADAAKNTADQAASDLLSLSGRTGRVIRATSAPTAAADKNSNNLWLNTSTGQLHEWTGSEWQVITDSRLTAAADAADQAANLAGNAQQAAETAQTRAEAAESLAGTAKGAADTAQAAAEAAASLAGSADTKAQNAATDAAAAQATADRLWAQAENRVYNPSFEDGTNGWPNPNSNSTHITITDSKDGGTKAITHFSTSSSATAYYQNSDKRAYIAPGRVVKVGGWVRLAEDQTVPTDSVDEARIYLRGFSETGGSAGTSAPAKIPAVNLSRDWTWLEATFTVPGSWTGGTAIGVGRSGAGGIRYEFDALVMQDVTEAVAAQTKADQAVADAAAAKDTADAAAAKAAGAQSRADDAMGKATTADGRYTVATANPTTSDASGKPIGAVWEVRSGGTSVRRYVLTGATTWTQVKIGQDFIGTNAIGSAQIADAAVGTAQIADATITNAKIGDLDVGKLTASGTSKFDTAVMKALIADSGFFDLIYANKVIVAGENLLPDPLIQNPRAWRNDSRISTTGGRTGGGSILIPASTSQSGIYNASTAEDMPYAVKVTPGQRYNISAWFTSAVAGVGTTNKVTLYERFFDGNGASVPGIAMAANAVKFSADTWTKLSGESRVAPDDAVYMAVGFFVQSAHNSEVRFSDPSVRSMTDGDLIVDGGILARHLSADSVTAAAIKAGTITATEIASNAITTVKIGANQVTAAKIAANTITANEIASKTITANEIAANTITASQIAANAITGNEIAANSITAANLAIGDFANRIPGIDKIAMVGRNGLTAATLGLPSPIGVNTGNNTFWLQGTKTVSLTSIISLEPGEYQVTAEVAASVSGTRYYFQLVPQTGQTSINYIVSSQLAGTNSTTFRQYTNDFTVSEAQSGEHVLRIFANHPNGTANPDGYQWFRNVSIRKRMGGELIVDGAITARNIASQTITSSELASNSVTAVKIASGQVTTVKLAAGAVTAEKITASQALVDKLITSNLMSGKVTTGMFELGDNVRWTNDGLYFYTPVVGNQSVTDWANRQALIAITPTGDSSITVASGSEPTGGMNPDGTVWGSLGSFNELEVGGTPFVNYDGPRGPMVATTLSANTTINTSERILIRDKFSPEAGRLYRFTARLSMAGTASGYFAIKVSRTPPVGVGNTSIIREGWDLGNGASSSQTFIGYIPGSILVPDANGEIEIGYSAETKSGTTALWAGSGTTDALSGTYFLIEDAGPDISFDVATASTPGNVTPPPPTKKTYTKTYKATGVEGYTIGGSRAGDNRNITAGSYFGSAMSEKLLYSMPSTFYSDLSGATIKSAKISIRCTKTYYGTGIKVYTGVTSTSGLPTSMPSYTNTNLVTIKPGQTITATVPSSYYANVKSGRGITIVPQTAASLASYGYFDATTTKITVTYEK